LGWSNPNVRFGFLGRIEYDQKFAKNYNKNLMTLYILIRNITSVVKYDSKHIY